MKKLLALSLIGSTFYILPSKSEVTVSSGTKIYYSDAVPITSFSDSSGIGLGNGYTFTSDYQCFSNVTANSLNGGIITNQACLNKIIKPGSTSVIEIAPEIDDANIEIGSGTTIMSYNGLCDSEQNIPASGVPDNYFHVNSLDRMVTFLENFGECNTDNWIEDNNQEPVANANPCGALYFMPKNWIS